MKNYLLKLHLILFIISGLMEVAIAQAPEGVVYQAEARSATGEVIANQALDVEITIFESSVNGNVVWEGSHKVITNDYGMFVLVIGTGNTKNNYKFSDIKWGGNAHFFNVQVKDPASGKWIDMGTSQFLSVPYALHAKTAGEIISESEITLKSALPGVKSQTWSLFGNRGTDSGVDQLGTTDEADLVFVTNNKEMLRITAEEKLLTPSEVSLDIGGNLTVHGDSTNIDEDFYVGRDVLLNVDDSFNPRGETFNYGNFTVENNSSTLLTGSLQVNGKTNLNSNLTVGNSSPTFLSGALDVQGNSSFEGDLTMTGKNGFISTGIFGEGDNLSISGEGTRLVWYPKKAAFRVGQITGQSYNDFWDDANVGTHSVAMGYNTKASGNLSTALGYRTIANGYGSTAMGGKVSTNGKTGSFIIGDHSLRGTYSSLNDNQLTSVFYNGHHFISNNTSYVATFENIQGGVGDGIAIKINKKETTDENNFITFYRADDVAGRIEGYHHEYGDPLVFVEDVIKPMLKSTNSFFTSTLGFTNPIDLKLDFIQMTGGSLPSLSGGSLPSLDIAFWKSEFDFNKGSFPSLNKGSFPQLSFQSPIIFNTGVTKIIQPWTWFKPNWSSLIQTQSNPVYKLFAEAYENDWKTLTDMGITELFIKAAEMELEATIKSEGVTYGSKGADYAEWLPRENMDDKISIGQVVGVHGGKISLITEKADQILVISSKPIVLGNMPEQGKDDLYEKVAFMGQVPTWVTGHVSIGDYILASGKNDGVGIAVSPDEIDIRDISRIVGKAWSNSNNLTLSLINVAIGLNRNDISQAVMVQEKNIKDLEARIERVEKRMEMISGSLTDNK